MALTTAELALCGQAHAMCACERLRRAARGVTQLYDAALASSGLKVTQLPILVGLAIAGPLPITALADALGLDRTTLTRNAGVLEQRGLGAIVEHDDDARMRMLSLTPQGSSVLSAALERWSAVHEQVQARFGSERLQALYAELEALSAAVAD